MHEAATDIFETFESNVRLYCRSLPVVFARAQGALMYSEQGDRFVDFLSGAGALNYGHNDAAMKKRLLAYLERDGVIQGLDLYTDAKREFLSQFVATILKPRGLEYRVQFCGPTGTNAVEAALKLARSVTKRHGVVAFMGSYHGMSLGSLAVTGNRESRGAAGIPLAHTTFVPYESGPDGRFDAIDYLERAFRDPKSGIDLPAAVIVETVQAEGGVYVASVEWLKALAALCRRYGVLLICDDIQVGCGRTGSFFSFERAGIVPDIVTLSKSISGYGLPMSLALIRREHDRWKPGEHTGTFRGAQLSFVTAAAALSYWEDGRFAEEIRAKATYLQRFTEETAVGLVPGAEVRGIGMIRGLDLGRAGGTTIAAQVAQECARHGLIVERCGRDDVVVKLLPPLTIDMSLLAEGCDILVGVLKDMRSTWS